MRIRADLHNHSCLSPCGDLEMSPTRLAERAAALGIGMLALTDHNSAKNCPAFDVACRRHNVIPLFGTETTSREEVHILSLFRTVEEALDWGSWVYARLPDFRHDPEKLGDQVVVDVDETIIEFEERYLVPGINASIEEIREETLRRGGLIIPAHIDRSANSIYSQLGFLPGLEFTALEITRRPIPIDTAGHAVICDSDAHFVDDIGRRSFTFPAGDGDDPFTALIAALETEETELSIDG
ncbi:MAG: PHP domain-containing protein [Alkalispirochaeta sp.]